MENEMRLRHLNSDSDFRFERSSIPKSRAITKNNPFHLREFVETHVILAPGAWKWGSEQRLLPPLPRPRRHHRVNSRRLDFMRRRGTSEHLAPPEAALAARGGSVELWVGPGRPNGALRGPGGTIWRVVCVYSPNCLQTVGVLAATLKDLSGPRLATCDTCVHMCHMCTHVTHVSL